MPRKLALIHTNETIRIKAFFNGKQKGFKDINSAAMFIYG
jgi:hypothetical protein